MLTYSINRRIITIVSSKNRRTGGRMKAIYTGYYRTRLTPEEKEAFKKLALAQGEVTQVHDDLIRNYIKEVKNGTARISK